MSAQSSAGVNAPIRRTIIGRPATELVRPAAAAVAGLLLLAALLLSWRRLEGDLTRPLSLPLVVAVAVVTAATVAAVRVAWGYRPRLSAVRLDWIVPAVLSAAGLSMAAAVSVPESEQRGIFILWGILAAEESWAWGRHFSAWRRLRYAAFPGGSPQRTVRLDRPQPPRAQPLAAAVLHQPPAAEVLQQLTRCRTADGGEVLSGWLRVPLAAGQRSTNVHIAFCPPFGRTPTASVDQVEGPPARIKTVQLLPYGVRFDLKLANPTSTAETLLLQFSAEAELEEQSEGMTE